MIDITKNQEVFGHPEYVVVSLSGSYEEVDLIECETVGTPEIVRVAFQAQFVKYGDAVYHQAQPLTFDQVAALEVDAPMESVINNQDLIDGKISHLDLAPNEPRSEATKPRIPSTADELPTEDVVEKPAVGDIVGPSVSETLTETTTDAITE